jgi:hypothetical protein
LSGLHCQIIYFRIKSCFYIHQFSYS